LNILSLIILNGSFLRTKFVNFNGIINWFAFSSENKELIKVDLPQPFSPYKFMLKCYRCENKKTISLHGELVLKVLSEVFGCAFLVNCYFPRGWVS
jgi:hypothetical protein